MDHPSILTKATPVAVSLCSEKEKSARPGARPFFFLWTSGNVLKCLASNFAMFMPLF